MYRYYTIFLLLSLSAVGYTNAAVSQFCAEKPPELADQEGCYVEPLKEVIPYGDYYPKTSCTKYTCYLNDTTEVSTCDVKDIKKDRRCRLIANEAADYPACCPVLMCSTFPPEASEDVTMATDRG